MGYITSKQLSGNEGLTGPARKHQIERARIKELEEQIAREKTKKDGNESRVAGSAAGKSSGKSSKDDKKHGGKRKSNKASEDKP